MMGRGHHRMTIETPRPTQIGGFVLIVQIGALEVENVNQIKYEGIPYFPVTASSTKIGFSELI